MKTYKTNAKCPNCGKSLVTSDIRGYGFLCKDCDENFYTFEVIEDSELSEISVPMTEDIFSEKQDTFNSLAEKYSLSFLGYDNELGVADFGWEYFPDCITINNLVKQIGKIIRGEKIVTSIPNYDLKFEIEVVTTETSGVIEAELQVSNPKKGFINYVKKVLNSRGDTIMENEDIFVALKLIPNRKEPFGYEFNYYCYGMDVGSFGGSQLFYYSSDDEVSYFIPYVLSDNEIERIINLCVNGVM